MFGTATALVGSGCGHVKSHSIIELALAWDDSWMHIYMHTLYKSNEETDPQNWFGYDRTSRTVVLALLLDAILLCPHTPPPFPPL